MKNNEQAPKQPEHERILAEQHKRKEWGEDIAKKFGVIYTGEFFEVPRFDNTGKEIGRTHVHAWEEIPFWSNDGKEIVERADIENVIAAILKYPETELREAIKRVEREEKNNKRSD